MTALDLAGDAVTFLWRLWCCAFLLLLSSWAAIEVARTVRTHSRRAADVARVRSLEPADDWTAIADTLDQPSPHLDPVVHARTGCLYCATAIDMIRSIAQPDCWDVALTEWAKETRP